MLLHFETHSFSYNNTSCDRTVKHSVHSTRLQQTFSHSFNFLKLNEDKTEILLVAPQFPFSSGSEPWCHQTVHYALNVTSIISLFYFHLCNINRLRPFLSTQHPFLSTVSSIVSRIDCCNSLLHGLPHKPLHQLQQVQDCAADMISRTPPTSTSLLSCRNFTGSL